MTKQGLAFIALVFILGTVLFSSCKKINEATELGSDLIPPIDNVHTFETFLDAETNNEEFLIDTTRLTYYDSIALGYTNDPEFGQTKANIYFNISSNVYGIYPFIDRASVAIDSVVLSLAYSGAYGDTNSMQTVRVFEIAQSASLDDTTLYKYNHPDLPTTGAELGSKTFVVNTLNDPVTVIRKDTQTVSNVLRIKLNNSLGQRFASYETDSVSTGGFKNDSIFQTLFKGIALKTDVNGNALTYFNVFDRGRTKLTVYFTATKDGKKDTASADFTHVPITYANFTHPAGVVNSIQRTKGGNWATYLANGNPKDDKLYIQSAPGSYATVKFPALSNMSNKVVHLAELITYRVPSMLDNIFTPPSRLFLDRVNNNSDSAFLLQNDLPPGSPLDAFGGQLKNDNTYRFNITRHIQHVLIKSTPNQTLRIYAPLRTTIFNRDPATMSAAPVTVPVNGEIARGRVVLSGGNHSDPAQRMRLRIVYSDL